MKMKSFLSGLCGLIILLILWEQPLWAQNEQQKLETQKKEIEKEIAFTNKLLEQTKKSRSTSLNQLTILKNKIGKREALITTMNAEIRELNKQILKNQETIGKLKEDIAILKEEYAEMIYHAYKNRSAHNRLMFIFAAESFNQAYQRLRYLQQYSIIRKKQAELIQATQLRLNSSTIELEKQITQKKTLLSNQQKEKKQLDLEIDEKDKTVQQLQDKENELKRTLKKKEKAATDLSKKIDAIIAENIRKAEQKAGVTKTPATTYALTPEEIELAKSFSSNKGKLPWPSQRGIVSGTFGQHRHPDFKNIIINNDGINILTNEGEKIRAVFEGEVTAVISVEQFNYVVIIKHGDYRTVYTNLDVVHVKQGDKVSTKQVIGIVHTNKTESKSEFHFEVLQGRQKLNPQHWLAPKK